MGTITRGMPTPWGEAQTKKELAPGVFLVTTAGHGGILIGKRRAKELLSERASKIGMPWGSFLAYEEDCDVSAVFYEHPEYCTLMDAKASKEYAENSLQRWYPEYFKAE
jgi:hypothetical protein